jgi:hypothetical protein
MQTENERMGDMGQKLANSMQTIEKEKETYSTV